MKVIVKGSFDRDVDKVHNKELRYALDAKISQIENANSVISITGLKLLEGYSHHYRIIVRTENRSFRIGAIIRNETLWLVRFLPRKKIYETFP